MVHIVLVHGACHGAWCWHKVKPPLEAAGHRVTALDMAASGIDPRSIDDLRSFDDYTQPLTAFMASIPEEEKVVLVGHSLGGMNISVAMEMYPHKIKVAVFLAAFLPHSTHPPSYVLHQFNESIPAQDWLDTKFLPYGDNLTSLTFGPDFVSSKLYQLCSPEDVALANMLLRPSSLFLGDMLHWSPFSKEGFGSVKKVYIVCPEDKTIPLTFQRWQTDNFGVDQVMEIENADHMPMFSRPHQLCQYLLHIAADN